VWRPRTPTSAWLCRVPASMSSLRSLLSPPAVVALPGRSVGAHNVVKRHVKHKGRAQSTNGRARTRGSDSFNIRSPPVMGVSSRRDLPSLEGPTTASSTSEKCLMKWTTSAASSAWCTSVMRIPAA
jgi:hypothetical protein